jgi:hypothetical protein
MNPPKQLSRILPHQPQKVLPRTDRFLSRFISFTIFLFCSFFLCDPIWHLAVSDQVLAIAPAAGTPCPFCIKASRLKAKETFFTYRLFYSNFYKENVQD